MNSSVEPGRDHLNGAASGLAAAALFGAGTPLAKLFLPRCNPLLLGALLYLGAGLSISAYRLLRRRHPHASREPRIRRSDFPLLAALIGLGGVVGPLLMLHGLTRLSGVTASLLLNLEAPFTILLAVALFGEHLGLRPATASATIVSGAILLSTGAGPLGGDTVGALALAASCLCWAIDNNLSQRLSLRDPIAVVQVKTLGAGVLMSVLSLLSGQARPPAALLSAALGLGAVSYGVSLVLDMRALRLLGAAREAGFFATAPFFGAALALPVLGETLRPRDAMAAGLMALGVAALLRERHRHRHAHEALVHDHLHIHDEHHRHEHAEPVSQPHSHPHRHERLVHDHPHVSDLHHRHRHA